MSKQLKLKFKKILKKADFMNADLEYHQEMSSEAKNLFNEEVQSLIGELSDEDQEALNQKRAAPAAPLISESEEGGPSQDPEEPPISYTDCTSLVVTDADTEEESPRKTKSIELKKLFRKIAEQSHPDKVRADGFSEKEVNRLERVFKKAHRAYENENWYVLYSIAVDLDIPLEAPSDASIEWLEEDINKTMHQINMIKNLVAVVWFTGNDQVRKEALRYYFLQIYNFTHPTL